MEWPPLHPLPRRLFRPYLVSVLNQGKLLGSRSLFQSFWETACPLSCPLHSLCPCGSRPFYSFTVILGGLGEGEETCACGQAAMLSRKSLKRMLLYAYAIGLAHAQSGT